MLSLLLNPLSASFHESNGLKITNIPAGSPASLAGLSVGEVIKEIDGNEMKTVEDFKDVFKGKNVGDKIDVLTDKSDYSIVLAKNPETSRRWFGVFVEEDLVVAQPTLLKSVIIWLDGLFFWLFLLSLGVGLFNLVPLGPIDGGKMLQISLEKFAHKKRANLVWKAVSMVTLAVILANLIPAFF